MEVLLRRQMAPNRSSIRRQKPHTIPRTAYRESGTPVSGVDDGDTADSERGGRNRKQDLSNIYSVIQDLGLVFNVC